MENQHFANVSVYMHYHIRWLFQYRFDCLQVSQNLCNYIDMR